MAKTLRLTRFSPCVACDAEKAKDPLLWKTIPPMSNDSGAVNRRRKETVTDAALPMNSKPSAELNIGPETLSISEHVNSPEAP